MESSTKDPEVPNKNNKKKTLAVIGNVIGIIALIAFVVVWLGGCVFFGCSMVDWHEKKSGPDRNGYVGVWACYKVKVQSEGEKSTVWEPESLGEADRFMTLKSNGNAQIVMKMRGSVHTIDCKWTTTSKDKRTGEEAGIVLLGDDFENPFEYFYLDNTEGNLISEALVPGGLCIDFGYREEYYEKVSDNPDYQPWAN